jgi:hypothetical protein
LVDQAVELVDLPVEVLLIANHAGADGRTQRPRVVQSIQRRAIVRENNRWLDPCCAARQVVKSERSGRWEMLSQRKVLEGGPGEFIARLPFLVSNPTAYSAVPFVVTVLLQPEARGRAVQHTEESEVVVLGRALRQLDNWGRAVEHLAAAVEDKMIVSGDEGEGDGRSVGVV